MRVVISNLAWLDKRDLSEPDQFMLKKKLTLIPKQTGFEDQGEDQKIIEMWRETETHLGVPRFFYEANKQRGNEEDIQVADGVPLNAVRGDGIVLRPEDQAPLVESLVRHLRLQGWGGGMVEAYTAAGKSYCALEVVAQLGRNAMLLVHKEPLMDQWEENIRRFFPGAKIGRVQGDRCEYRGYDFVIGMIQSMMGDRGDKYPDEMYHHFGVLFVDEVHRMGAPAFCSVAPRFSARFMFGLSGTIRRKDQCEEAFLWSLGTEKFKISQQNRLNPIVYVRETGFQAVKKTYINRQTGLEKVFDMNAFRKPTQLQFITDSDHRTNLIAHDVVQSLKSGRNPLVMSERLEMLSKICAKVAEKAQVEFGRVITQGMYIGGKSKEELASASKCEVVYATSQLAQEGIDIPCFPGDQLVLGRLGFVPISTLQQGDLVYSHKGVLQKVLGVSRKPYNGNMVKILSLGHSDPVLVTPEHVVPVLRTKRCPYANTMIYGREIHSRCKPTCKKIHRELIFKKKDDSGCDLHLYRDYQIEWIKAEEIQVGDCVGLPVQWASPELKSLDVLRIKDWAKLFSYKEHKGFFSSKFRNQNGVSIKSELLLGRDFCWLLGIFFAEGHTCSDQSGRIYFSLHKNETILHEKIKIMMLGFFGLTPVKERSYDGNGLRITFVNKLVASFLEGLVGRLSPTKVLPPFLWNMGFDCVSGFLSGWWWGDGSDVEDGEMNIATASRMAVNDMRLLLLRFGIFSTISSTQRTHSHNMNYVLCFNGDFAKSVRSICRYDEPIVRRKRMWNKSWEQFGLMWSPIRSTSFIDWRGDVFNLSVENDETYVLPQFAVHNCLDTLFLTTPMSDVEQACGRVTRSVPGKKTPMVVDYLDSSLDTFKGIFYSRLKLYKRLGWQVLGMK